MIGTTLQNRYRIDAEPGYGSMGMVYRGNDTLPNRPVRTGFDDVTLRAAQVEDTRCEAE